MQNWRNSYDAQKSKLLTNSTKQTVCPTFLVKSNPQKNQLNLNLSNNTSTDPANSFKKYTVQQKLSVRGMQFSKSPNRSISQKLSLPKDCNKPMIAVMGAKECKEPTAICGQNQHKSSVITQDSQDSNNQVAKMFPIDRCISKLREQKKSPMILRANKIENNKKQLSPIRGTNISNKSSTKLQAQQKLLSGKIYQKYQKCQKEGFTKNDNVKIDDFQFRSELGRGYYSVVYLAKHKKTQMIFAIKIIFKQAINTDSLRENIFREMKIHSYVKNPNLLSLYKIIHDEKYIYMIMQYAIGGTLYSLVKNQKRLSQQRCSKLLRDICRGLKYLHDADIIHRDLKLENIMLIQGIGKIGDFGCAVHSVCMRKSNIGSPAYLSPQQLNHNFYGKKIDIWSLGIMTYQMLFQSTPFDKQIIDALKTGELSYDMKVKFPPQIQVSPQAKDFISRCLMKKQISRMSVQEALNHPFLNLVAENIYNANVRP